VNRREGCEIGERESDGVRVGNHITNYIRQSKGAEKMQAIT
jgi:hypothetical protein